MSKHHKETTQRSGSPESSTGGPDPKIVQALAYELWLSRGCPIGSDQEDWFNAEEQLRGASSVPRAA